ncbi:MAG: GspH/FimT family protein [Arhodomonas sp.]|nr:GspH/FimT family protein [Arhodomonas sp.]
MVETLRLQAAARDTASGLRAARTQALRERREAGLVVNVETGEYRLSTGDGVRSLPANAEVGLTTGGADILSEEEGRIVFFPDGSSNGGRVTVTANGQRYRVDVNWLTGRVRILDE